MRLLHITTPAAWAAAQSHGALEADSLPAQGFIHLSTPAQVCLAADTHYQGQFGLVLLCIDGDELDSDSLRFEAGSPPNAHLDFPHLYGPLPVAAVVAVAASAATAAAAVAAADAGSHAGRPTLNGHTRTSRKRKAGTRTGPR